MNIREDPCEYVCHIAHACWPQEKNSWWWHSIICEKWDWLKPENPVLFLHDAEDPTTSYRKLLRFSLNQVGVFWFWHLYSTRICNLACNVWITLECSHRAGITFFFYAVNSTVRLDGHCASNWTILPQEELNTVVIAEGLDWKRAF